MIFEDRFTVPVSPDRAWELLNDVPAVAPCFPGATLETCDGDEFRGSVRIKVGPVVAEYAGTAVRSAQDPVAGTVVIEATGRERRGAGLATAVVTASLAPASGGADGIGGTDVLVHTDLRVTGRLAQFGSAVLQPISAALISRFADNLRDLIASSPSPSPDPGPAPAAPAPAEAAPLHARDVTPAAARSHSRSIEGSAPADLLRLPTMWAVARRVAGALVPVMAASAVVLMLRRRRRA